MSAVPQPARQRCSECGSLYDREARTNEAMALAHLIALAKHAAVMVRLLRASEATRRHVPGLVEALGRVVEDELNGRR